MELDRSITMNLCGILLWSTTLTKICHARSEIIPTVISHTNYHMCVSFVKNVFEQN